MDEEKIDIVLDLDNTLLCSININRKKEYPLRFTDMPGYYRIYHRPYLQEFLDYIFYNFNVSVWTAGESDYADFVCENVIQVKLPYETDVRSEKYENTERKIKNIFSSEHCGLSQKKYSLETEKDLRFLYDTGEYTPCSTIIIDDRQEVSYVNFENAIKIPAFYAHNGKKDFALAKCVEKLKKRKELYDKISCVYRVR